MSDLTIEERADLLAVPLEQPWNLDDYSGEIESLLDERDKLEAENVRLRGELDQLKKTVELTKATMEETQ